MGRTMSTWTAEMHRLLGRPGGNRLPEPDRIAAVQTAIRQFSHDRPREVHRDFVGDGVLYDLAIPLTGTDPWVHEFSALRKVEYPLGDRPLTPLDMAEVTLYPDESRPTHIRLNSTTPASGQTARIHFTVPWPVPTNTAADDKIEDVDFDAVVHLAAYFGAQQLSADAVDNTHSSLPAADLVDTNEEYERWQRIARARRQVYSDHIGAGSGKAPASVIFDWDPSASWEGTGRRFLFHRGRR